MPFDDADTVRAIESCRLMLVSIGSPKAAEVETIERRVRGPFDAGPRAVEAKPSAASHRRMRSATFREEQWRHRFDPHVAPVNELVDRLIEQRDGSWMPYIPPYHGGVDAEIVLVYQDPGKMTSVDHGGSGFLGARTTTRPLRCSASASTQPDSARGKSLPGTRTPGSA